MPQRNVKAPSGGGEAQVSRGCRTCRRRPGSRRGPAGTRSFPTTAAGRPLATCSGLPSTGPLSVKGGVAFRTTLLDVLDPPPRTHRNPARPTNSGGVAPAVALKGFCTAPPRRPLSANKPVKIRRFFAHLKATKKPELFKEQNGGCRGFLLIQLLNLSQHQSDVAVSR